VSGQQHAPAALYPRERPGTHFTGDLKEERRKMKEQSKGRLGIYKFKGGWEG